jgi:hypothetical protein
LSCFELVISEGFLHPAALLQIIVRQGHHLETCLADSLSTFPATVWQPATPQLLAQLPQASTSEAARRLILSRLSALAAESPASLLYPCLLEARIAEAADQEMTPELRVYFFCCLDALVYQV